MQNKYPRTIKNKSHINQKFIYLACSFAVMGKLLNFVFLAVLILMVIFGAVYLIFFVIEDCNAKPQQFGAHQFKFMFAKCPECSHNLAGNHECSQLLERNRGNPEMSKMAGSVNFDFNHIDRTEKQFRMTIPPSEKEIYCFYYNYI